MVGESPFLLVMVSSSLLVTAVALAVAVGPDAVVGSITSSLQYVLKNTHGGNEYEYPTDITRDIRPVGLLIRITSF